MKKHTLITLLLASLALLSCRKDTPRNTGMLREDISFSASLTKGLLGRTDLLTNGTKVHIVDVLTDFDGKVNGTAWTSGEKYIDEDVVYTGSTVWDFESGKIFPWTTSGTHVFRGWLTYDAKGADGAGISASDLFGNGISYADGVLTIPDTELNTLSPQFDMLYSETVLRDMSDTPRPTGTVPVKLQHLFSALSLYIMNSSVDSVLVTAVSTTGLQNRKSARTDFRTAPVYTTLTPQDGFVKTIFTGSDSWFTTGDKYDLLTDTKNPSAMSYSLIWPQTAEEMAAARIHISYVIKGDYEDDGVTLKTHVTSLKFPEDASMNPGYRYQYILTFVNKRVKLLLDVQPWDYNQFTWDYEDSTISECTQLTWVGTNGVDYLLNGKNISFLNGQPIKAFFGIKTPKGGQWDLELRGNTSDNLITVSPDAGHVNADIDDGRIYLTFTPNLSVERTGDVTVSLQFWVTFLNGYVKDLNSEINYDNWTITLPQ